ncbi:MAG: hypothetical protein ND895_21320, partial [Pyrinomonadaceae bacterium]|nr:hypothetical protein [Pyrinomonadaceae bacterium]
MRDFGQVSAREKRRNLECGGKAVPPRSKEIFSPACWVISGLLDSDYLVVMGIDVDDLERS